MRVSFKTVAALSELTGELGTNKSEEKYGSLWGQNRLDRARNVADLLFVVLICTLIQKDIDNEMERRFAYFLVLSKLAFRILNEWWDGPSNK